MDTYLESLRIIRARRIRKAGIILTCALMVFGLPVAWFGPPLYSRWHQDRLVRKARVLIASGYDQAAVTNLRRVLAMNLDNLPASRMMADLAEKQKSPQALGLRKHITVLQPDSFDDALAWALSALRFNDPDAASQALAILRRTGPGDARCHEIAGRIASASGREPEAAAEFAKALQLDPGDARIQLEAATNAIQSKDPLERDEAIKKLYDLISDPDMRVLALRALVRAAGKDVPIQMGLLARIARDPGAEFRDKIAYLDAMYADHALHFSSYLRELEISAQSKPEEAADLVSWMNREGFSMLAADWAASLQPAMVSKPPVAGEVAESYVLLLDWKKLRAFTATGNWGASEYLRHAFLSRALGEGSDRRGSENHWNTAVILATRWLPWLLTLDRVADKWDWQAERETILWLIAGKSEKPRRALDILAQRYAGQGDSHQLLQVWKRVTEIDPSDTAALNNWTLLSLLLGENKESAPKTAASLAAKNPSDPAAVSTGALALHLQQRTDEGLQMMRHLKPGQLASPPVAAVYGILLAARKSPDAARYLDIAEKASLVPEEEDLVAEAKNPAPVTVRQPRNRPMVQLPSQLPQPQRTKFMIDVPLGLPMNPKPRPSPAGTMSPHKN